MPDLVVVASENGRSGALRAMELLKEGVGALDAAEAACRVVEDDVRDQSVGRGGIPNLLGQVELDASLMDGRDLRAGAVAGVRDYGNVISLARRVMDELPHVLLEGRGAERLAAEMGLQPEDQRTFDSLERWRKQFTERGLDLGANGLRELADLLTRPLNLEDRIPTGTVNFLVRDREGNLATGVSTSGLGWKYPGRVGDSPIVGAGNYCDNRYGAAACTGMGEMAMRLSTARSLVLYRKMGMSLDEAGRECLQDLTVLPQPPGRYLNIVALAPDGTHAGFSTVPDKRYLFFEESMSAPETCARQTLNQ